MVLEPSVHYNQPGLLVHGKHYVVVSSKLKSSLMEGGRRLRKLMKLTRFRKLRKLTRIRKLRHKIHKDPLKGYASSNPCWGRVQWKCLQVGHKSRYAAFMNYHSC